MSRYVIGIDQGTTGTFVGLMDGDGTLVAHAYEQHRQIYPQTGWVEQAPLELWNIAANLLNEVIDQSAVNADAIAGIGIANQGESVMVWDAETGQPLHNILVWQDTRTQRWTEKLAADSTLANEISRRTGLRLDSYFSASKIRWLLDNVPDASKLLDAGRLRCGTLDTWLIWQLTDGRNYVTDVSTASRTLLFNIHTLTWDDWLLQVFDIPGEILAEVKPSTSHLGTVSAALLRCQGVPILASLVDQPAAMIGQGCLQAGQIKATYGTGCFINLNTGQQPVVSSQGLLTMLAWQRGDAVTYGLDGGVLAAGTSVNWSREALGLLPPNTSIDEMVDHADYGSVMWIPALIGLGPPYWNRSMRGAWLGINLETDRAQLVRAVLEGIALRVVQLVRAMMADTALEIRVLRADGGLTNNAALMQLQADLLGYPVEVLLDPEATASGACYLAARQAGIWETDQQMVPHIRVARTYEPSLSADVREARLDRFDRAVKALATWQSDD